MNACRSATGKAKVSPLNNRQRRIFIPENFSWHLSETEQNHFGCWNKTPIHTGQNGLQWNHRIKHGTQILRDIVLPQEYSCSSFPVPKFDETHENTKSRPSLKLGSKFYLLKIERGLKQCKNIFEHLDKHSLDCIEEHNKAITKISLDKPLWIFGDFAQNLTFKFLPTKLLFWFKVLWNMQPNVIEVEINLPLLTSIPNVWWTPQAWRMQSGWFWLVFWKHPEVLTWTNLVWIRLKNTTKPSQKFPLTNPLEFWWFWPKSEVQIFELKITLVLPSIVENVTKCDLSWIKLAFASFKSKCLVDSPSMKNAKWLVLTCILQTPWGTHLDKLGLDWIEAHKKTITKISLE